MSASDKKQQKKALQAEGLSQKELREQTEAAAAKRRKTIYWAIGIVCAVAAAGLLIWNGLSGMAEKKNVSAVAATVDGVNYTVGDMQYYYNSARQNAIYTWQMYAYYGISYSYNPYLADGAQWYDEAENKTYADYFRESSVTLLKNTAALCKAAKEAGYTLSDEGKATIEKNLSQIDIYCLQNGGISRSQYLSQVYGAGVTEAVYVKHLTNDLLAQEYQNYHKENLFYTDEELKAYYDEKPVNYDSFDYRVFFIDGTAANPVDENGDPLKDEDGKVITATEEEQTAALAKAKDKADAAVAEIEAAADPEKSFIALAPTLVSEGLKESYENDESATLEEGVLGASISNLSFASWLTDPARKSGDVTSIQSGKGYNVVLFLDRYLVNDPTVDMRHILIQPEIADDAETNSYGTKVPSLKAMEAAKTKAQSILDEWKAGDATEESFAALAEQHSADGRDADGNLSNPVYDHVRPGDMVPNIDKWLFESGRKPGDVTLVDYNEENGRYYGWHIVYYVGENEPYWKYDVAQDKASDDQTSWLKEIGEAITGQAADGMQYVGEANTATPTATPTPAESTAPSESVEPSPGQE